MIVRINNTELDLPLNVVAYTKRINDIGEIEKIKFDYSNRIALPNTLRNRKALGLADLVQSVDLSVYRIQRVSLYDDGIEVVHNGSLRIESANDDVIEVAIYSGVLDFFERIKGLTIQNINLGGQINWRRDVIWAFRNNASSNSYFTWPAFEWGGSVNASVPGLWAPATYPWVFVKSIWDQIIQDAGALIEYPDVFSTDIISIATLDLPEDEQDQTFIASDGADKAVLTPGAIDEGIYPAGLTVLQNPRDLVVLSSPARVVQIRTFKASYVFRLTIKNYSADPAFFGSNGAITIRLFVNGAPTTLTPQAVVNPGIPGVSTSYNWEFETDIDPGDEVSYSVVVTAPFAVVGDYLYTIDFSIIEQSGTADTITYGSPINPVKQLAEIDQTEFMKAVSVMYGLVWSYDEYEGKIVVRKFDDLQDNIPFARDWSENTQDSSIAFQVEPYAQSNIFAFSNQFGRASILVDNEKLDKETTIIELPWGSFNTTFGYLRGGIDIKTGRLVSDDSEPQSLYGRLNLVNSVPVAYAFTDPSGSNFATDNIPFVEELYWDRLLDGNYQLLPAILNMAKVVQCRVKLLPADFCDFDFLIPVYIARHNAYFYVAEIRNYVSGELTGVKLIKLG